MHLYTPTTPPLAASATHGPTPPPQVPAAASASPGPAAAVANTMQQQQAATAAAAQQHPAVIARTVNGPTGPLQMGPVVNGPSAVANVVVPPAARGASAPPTNAPARKRGSRPAQRGNKSGRGGGRDGSAPAAAPVPAQAQAQRLLSIGPLGTIYARRSDAPSPTRRSRSASHAAVPATSARVSQASASGVAKHPGSPATGPRPIKMALQPNAAVAAAAAQPAPPTFTIAPTMVPPRYQHPHAAAARLAHLYRAPASLAVAQPAHPHHPHHPHAQPGAAHMLHAPGAPHAAHAGWPPHAAQMAAPHPAYAGYATPLSAAPHHAAPHHAGPHGQPPGWISWAPQAVPTPAGAHPAAVVWAPTAAQPIAQPASAAAAHHQIHPHHPAAPWGGGQPQAAQPPAPQLAATGYTPQPAAAPAQGPSQPGGGGGAKQPRHHRGADYDITNPPGRPPGGGGNPADTPAPAAAAPRSGAAAQHQDDQPPQAPWQALISLGQPPSQHYLINVVELTVAPVIINAWWRTARKVGVASGSAAHNTSAPAPAQPAPARSPVAVSSPLAPTAAHPVWKQYRVRNGNISASVKSNGGNGASNYTPHGGGGTPMPRNMASTGKYTYA